LEKFFSMKIFFSLAKKKKKTKLWCGLFKMSMELPSDAKRARKTHPDFFGGKVKVLLIRVRRTMEALPGAAADASFVKLADLDFFLDATSMDEVLENLGGKDALAAKVLDCVTDADEKRQLELYSRKRQTQQLDLVRAELQSVVARAYLLAKDLQSRSDPLVVQVLALPVPDAVAKAADDEGGTGEQEEKKNTKSSRNKMGRSKSVEKKKSKKKKAKLDSGMEKKAEEDVDVSLSSNEVARLVLEAEKEIGRIRGSQAGSVEVEGPPNVKDLIGNANLEDVECLYEAESDSLEVCLTVQTWWCIVKRASQIRGIFQLIRAEKVKGVRIQQKYANVAGKLASRAVLSYAQASRYERLGKFLEQFPRFVFQRKWITLADWFQKVDNGAVLLDCIASIVPLSSPFLKDSFKLHEHGFKVYPGMMKDFITPELIATCKHRCEELGEAVFNNCKDVNSKENDGKRVQLSLEKIKGLEKFKTQLKERLLVHLPTHKVDAIVALLSKKSCKEQLEHTDFSPATLAKVLVEMPLACLVALTDGTVFDVWPYAICFDKSRTYKPMQIRLNAGDVLIFRGDLVHAGAAVGEVENVRIHAYLDADGIKRPKHKDGVEETYFMCDERHILKRK
jgi:hypothetical protein